ncbi:MAG: energy transducer TonB [Gammaproteobacteria bacterium]
MSKPDYPPISAAAGKARRTALSGASQPRGQRATVKPGDRLGLTLFLATVLHGLVILGVSFSITFAKPNSALSLDVVLVQTSSDEVPEHADNMAQANQLASGTADFKNRPTSPLAARVPQVSSGIAPLPTQEQSAARPKPVDDLVLSQDKAQNQISAAATQQPDATENSQNPQEQDQRRLEIARLVAELAEEERRFAERPRIHFVDTLSAKTAVEAAYIKAWVDKVERLGNLNYPDEARRRNLSGAVIVSVLMDTSGAVLKVEIASSSGSRVLDDAAAGTVALASPFERFPADMAESYDQLMITRTWVFESESLLTR